MILEAIKSYLKKNNFTKFQVKAVFFDMDGVLFDSMPNHAIAWEKAMNESGLPFTRREAYMNEGQTGSATINGVFVNINGREATEEEKLKIYKLKSHYFDVLETPKVMPYSYQLLQKIKSKGLQIFVVTGSAQPSLIDSLILHFPGIFVKEHIISAFDVKNGKPHPEPYQKALEKAGAKPWQAIVIENAPLGVQSSAAAKIFTIAVNTGPLDEDVLHKNGADIVLQSMKDLYEKWDSYGL
ncbi:MAG: HAD-superfamily hydrolase, subfamily variant 3 [Bacteroidetes bacterium]|nr:HAD-superfamily hydrolase, subfamily variant 3 [Bacteroidota bacterium]